MADIPDSALRQVESYFDARTVKAALELVDRVRVVKPLPWPVVSQVGGTQGVVVTVHHRGTHLVGDCSCEIGVDCKHAAATALVVFATEREDARRRAEGARQAAVGAWLAELGRGERPAAPAADKVVGYVLDLRDGDVGLTVLQCARLKRGLGAGSVIGALGDPHRGAPAWVDVDDLRRIALLRAVTRSAPSVVRLRVDRLHGDLLRELADTGRLFWESTRGEPLAYGPAVTESLSWREADGGARLGIDERWTIVAARDCHYVDVAAAAIGPLDLGVSAELVHRLVSGPPVPAAMRDTVERSLGPLLAPTRAVWIETEAAPEAPAAMRPRMFGRLSADRAAVVIDGEAVYGDERFVLGEWDPQRPITRDLVVEGRFRDRLDGLVAGLPHGGRAGSSLEVLADAKVVALSVVPALRGEGWDCELSEDFPHEAPEAEVSWVEHLRQLEGPDWFALELGVTIAGRTVPLLPILLQAIRDGQLVIDAAGDAVPIAAGINLRLPEGELVHVPAERVARWLRPLVELELRGLTAGELVLPAPVAAQVAEPGRFSTGAALDAARERLAALLDLAPRVEPRGFGGTLRGYQRVGLAWLRFLHDAGYGGLLADEMGLGKTVQVLAFLDGLRAEGRLAAPTGAPALVVAPRSVVGNWQAEALRFAPGLAPVVHLGGDRADAAHELRAPMVITSYQTLLRDLELLRGMTWSSVIFDEAQALKNPDTQLRAAAATLPAQSRFAITGTPIENHLGELWSQIDLAMPGVLGRRTSFDAVFRRPIEKYGAAPLLEHLRQRIRPFLLRRTKDTVALELPPRTEIVERVELDVPQRDLYESLRLSLDEEVRAALRGKGIHGSQMVILDALLKLRQCCCDPRLVKLPEARRVTASAKLERLMDMLEQLVDSERSTLVFSQFTSMLGLIERACERDGIATVKLTGATRDREQAIRRFQDGEARVFLISLKAGGVGLNLTRADTVIHYDPWWNPAAEAQATARAHRLGQDRPVMVYKLVARGTLEESMLQLQDDKRQLTAAALRDGGISHLAPDDLQALFRRLV